MKPYPCIILKNKNLIKAKNRISFLKLTLFLSIFVEIQNMNFAQKTTSFVDPMIKSGGHGHVFVGASVPFGAVQVGPNNIYKGWDWCSGYNYGDSLIIGFSQLHLSGTGIGDLADVLIMPITGKVKIDKGRQEFPHKGYLTTFSHKNEVAKAGYYSIKLDNGVAVKLTATERMGFHQYQFPREKNAHIIIDLKEEINDRSTDTYLEQTDDYTLKGYRFSSGWAKEQQVYFAIRSSKPIKNQTFYNEEKVIVGKKAQGTSVKSIIGFEEGVLVQLKVGISPVSADNALANIDVEIPHWDFRKVVKQADEKWDKELSRIEIQTSSKKKQTHFLHRIISHHDSSFAI